MNVSTSVKAPSEIAARLTAQERVLLFCVASRTDWARVGVSAGATALIVRNLVARDPSPSRYKLTPLGRQVLAALVSLPMIQREGDAA